MTDLQKYINRFSLLATPRFKLYAPDMLELRWNVYDSLEKKTIGYGKNIEESVDCALLHVFSNHLPLVTKNYVSNKNQN
jgi:hypothetical protein